MINSEIRTYIHGHKKELFKKLVEARRGNESKEENFRMNHAILLNELFQALNMDGNIQVENEFTVLEGRIDSLYGNFIIEYKYPTRIASSNTGTNVNFIEQVQRQINGFQKKTEIPFSKIMGVVFDGYYAIYIKKQGDWHISEPKEMTVDSYEEFLMRLLSVNSGGKALLAENLINDFGSASTQSIQAISVLYHKLEHNKETNKTKLLFQQWQTLYREVCGYSFETKDLKIKGLQEQYLLSADTINYSCLIFAIQTYFSLLIKVLSLDILAYLKGNAYIEKFCFHTESFEKLKDDFANMEEGGTFRRLGISNFLEGDFFSWYLYLWDDDIAVLMQTLIETFEQYDYSIIILERKIARDLLKNLYYELLPSVLRKNLGEFYTPDWLAEFLIEDLQPQMEGTLFLDPTCGSGTFLVMLIKKKMSHYGSCISPKELVKMITDSVRGYDLNPLAVICARANYIIALGELLSDCDEPIEIPVYLCDAMLTVLEGYDEKKLDGVWANIIKNAFAPVFQKKVDYVIGNPPWIDWQNLPENYRESIQKYWYDYRVFDHKGQKAQLGSAHDDISVLMTYVIMDNFLKDGAKLAFVINQNLLQAAGGGDGFRKFSIKEKIPVGVKSVNDFVEVEPFKALGANNKTATIILQKNEINTYPIAYKKWYKCDKKIIGSNENKEDIFSRRIGCKELEASPIDEHNSPWMIASSEEKRIFEKMKGTGEKPAYRARKGVDTSANAIFWVKEKKEIKSNLLLVDNSPQNSRKKVAQISNFPVEKDLVYPLLRGKDVKKWQYNLEYSIVLPYTNDGKAIGKNGLLLSAPNAFDYFYQERHGFIPVLRERASYKKFILRQDAHAPEYSLYNIGKYTFSSYKVIWKALAKGVAAVTISKDNNRMIVPDHNLLMVPLENEMEAYYLTGILNADIVSRFVNAYVAWFISGHILERIKIPKYCEKDILHTEIASLSKEAHAAVGNKIELEAIEKRLNERVNMLLLDCAERP